VRFTFHGVYESMSKNYIVRLKSKANLHVHNTSRGTANIKKAIKEIPKNVYVLPLLKMSLRVMMCKAPNGGLEAENTEYF
jgi:hypothetical protein